MDPFRVISESIVSSFLQIVHIWALASVPIFLSTRNQRRLLFHGRDTYLRISDLVLEENDRLTDAALLRMPEDAQEIAAIRWEPSELYGQPQADVEGFLGKLPTQMEGSVRVYLEQGLGPGVFKDYFSSDATNPIHCAYDHPRTRGYNGLSLQWRAKQPDAWFNVPSFIIFGETSPALMIIVKKVSTLEHTGGRLTCEQF